MTMECFILFSSFMNNPSWLLYFARNPRLLLAAIPLLMTLWCEVPNSKKPIEWKPSDTLVNKNIEHSIPIDNTIDKVEKAKTVEDYEEELEKQYSHLSKREVKNFAKELLDADKEIEDAEGWLKNAKAQYWEIMQMPRSIIDNAEKRLYEAQDEKEEIIKQIEDRE